MHLRTLNLCFSYYQVEEAKFMTMSACIYHFLTSAAMKPFHRSFSSCQRLLFIQPFHSVFLSSYILFWVSDTIIPLGRISQHVLSLPSNEERDSSCEKHFIIITLVQDSGNKVSRRAAITGTANITLGGRTVIQADVHLRGDLHPTRPLPQSSAGSSRPDVPPTSISIGRCTVISTGCVIKPPSRVSRGTVHYYPMKVGDNVFIGMYRVQHVYHFALLHLSSC
jgi:hypothetical protein